MSIAQRQLSDCHIPECRVVTHSFFFLVSSIFYEYYV